jgi:hypothetical protein
MINYTWTIIALDCTPEKVVTSIHWRYTGKNESNTTNETYGVVTVGEPDYENFTDFENLTFEQVTGWIENIYSQQSEEQQLTQLQVMQKCIAEQIELIEKPLSITLQPPF